MRIFGLDLLNIRPYSIGEQTTLYYIDLSYKIQKILITKEMLGGNSLKLPLAYKVGVELYIKDGQVFTDRLGEVAVIFVDEKTGVASEPCVSNFLSWELRNLFPQLRKFLKAKVVHDYKDRYPLVAFIDAKTSETLVEIPLSDYYTEHKGLLELEKVTKLDSDFSNSDIIVKTYDKETDEWILFELRRLRYWKALEDTKAQVQEEVQHWKEDL